MIRELVRSAPQIQLRYENFAWRKVPTTIGQSLSLPQEGEDVDAFNYRDALQPITDRLSETPLWPLWWILEILPTSYNFQNKQGKWVTGLE